MGSGEEEEGGARPWGDTEHCKQWYDVSFRKYTQLQRGERFERLKRGGLEMSEEAAEGSDKRCWGPGPGLVGG